MSGTVLQNVLFGEELDREKFERVVKMSQLERDLAIMDQREQTVIGEKGLNISGGQKARISLARALYSEADIYLLDDPLSAVDPHVAEELFKVIKHGLADKIVFLATH